MHHTTSWRGGRLRRRATATAGILALTLGLVGCSGSGGAGAGDDPGSGGSSSAPGGAGSPGSGDRSGDRSGDGSGDGDRSGGGPRDVPPAGHDAPGRPDAQGRQAQALERVPGSTRPVCVDVGNRRDVRSGGFLAGPFDDVRRAYGTAQQPFGADEVHLYLVPLHADSMPTVRVTATGPTRGTLTQATPADADQWAFYDTVVRLPKAGRWTLRVDTGTDRGCFVVEI